MRRRAFDVLVSTGGLLLAAILIVAGALLLWANSFVTSNVRNQLAAQKIYFPAAGTPALTANPEIRQYVTPYAGQQVLTGQQAEVFADHYIAVHLREIGGGKTYSQLSAQSQAQPGNAKLKATVQTLFQGETLRGLLLNAYAFGKMATIALWGAIASFIAAGMLLVLAILGFLHLRRVPDEAEMFTARRPVPTDSRLPAGPGPRSAHRARPPHPAWPSDMRAWGHKARQTGSSHG